MTVAIDGVIDLMPDMVVLVDGAGRVVHANAAFTAHVGCPRGGIAGRPLLEVLSMPTEELAVYLRRCAGSFQPVPGALALRAADGSVLRCRCDGAAVRGENARPGPVLLRCRPQTEAAPEFAVLTEKVRQLSREVLRRQRIEADLRRSEERLRLAVAAASMGTWDIDLVTGEAIFSDRCNALCGLPPGAPLDRAAFDAAVHPDDREHRATAMQAALSSGGSGGFDVEYRIAGRDGVERWIADRGIAVFAGGRAVRLIGTLLDVTERRHAAEHQRLLINELNHRVKNSLATVQSIAAQTLRHTPDPDAFQASFTSRLMALSHAHNLLTQTQWLGTELRRVIELELEPYRTADGDRIRLCGGPQRIGPKAAVGFGLAFHELATNAAKYGALSVPQGRVEVSWTTEAGADGRHLTVLWTEHGGPPVQPPRRRGFGSRLLERGLSYDLGGSVRLDFDPAGVRCTIHAPVQRLEARDHG